MRLLREDAQLGGWHLFRNRKTIKEGVEMKSAQVKILLLLSIPLSSWGGRFTTLGPREPCFGPSLETWQGTGAFPHSRPLDPKSAGCMFLESRGLAFS